MGFLIDRLCYFRRLIMVGLLFGLFLKRKDVVCMLLSVMVDLNC